MTKIDNIPLSNSHKLPALEGLRGIAALIVVIHHLRLTFFCNSSAEISLHLSFMPHVPARLFRATIEGLYNGTFAVWLFWVMSGFVLSLQFFLRSSQKSSTAAHDYLEEAFLRRYLRLLLPVLVSVLFAYLLLRFNLMFNQSMAEILGKPESVAWIKNWYTFPASVLDAFKSAVWQCFFSYDQSQSYNNVLWTMEPELYGSIFLFSFLALLGHRSSRFLGYPLFAIVSYKLGIGWLVAFIGGIALCDLFTNRTQLPLSRYSSQLSVFRRICNHPWLAISFWALVVTAAGFPNYYLSYVALAMGAIVMTLVSKTSQHVLTSHISIFLGRISFGLYLIHVPVICSFSCGAYLTLYKSLGHTSAALLVSAATVVISIILGYVFHLFVDLPAVRWSREFALFIMHLRLNKVRI